MKTIEFGTKTYQVAESWAELTPEQYKQLIMCPRLESNRSAGAGSFETIENEAAACRVWLGMSPKVWKNLVLTPWQWGQLRQQCAWLFTSKPEGKPPLDTFVHQGVNYHLPAANFTDSTAVDIAFANMAFVEFAHPDEPTPEALDRLIAILCRPRRTDWRKFQKSLDWNGDVREEFNEQRMAERAKALATLDIQTKLIILDYFERTNHEFLEQYGELFGGSREPRYGDGRGWIMLLKNVAKEGHFGDFDKVCKTPAHLLFATLLDDLLDQQERTDKTPTPNENY
ncbi:hypothetical protein GO730_00440 [Spirosoma sp. HMF3257]|uniref:Uncharacterized protein n=1 Tax=Spirosoma telluris TaxID=2183553 RepID=A0A327NDU5_9BACT|nr:hypothetical protein [Spirosoma telluris]RAI73272.1 hypothetical protein HMF3257_00430 [Spirosoma telluris]